MKVHFFNKKLFLQFSKFALAFTSIVALLLAFVDFDAQVRIYMGIGFLCLLVLLYISMLIASNKLSRVKVRINGNNVSIFYGDIFKQSDIKVIPFNEYFDTKVDDKIISHASLNGKFIDNHFKDVYNLDRIISTNEHMKKCMHERVKRNCGKNIRYELGSICSVDEYFILAFSHFDENNRATLTTEEYLSCLIRMWNEIDILYALKSVSLPLLGDGITRFKDNVLTSQELLNYILLSLKLSKIQFKSSINIVLTQATHGKINLFSIKEVWNNV